MKITGSILKEAREKQSLSISEVSMSTKINPKMISAIEEGREAQLPAKTFLKGFVRSYAIYLKLDVDHVMAALQQDLGENQQPAIDAAVAATAKRDEKVESPAISANPRILKGLAAGGVLFLLVMIVTVKGLVEKYEKEKAIDPVAQQEELKQNEPAAVPETSESKEETPTAEAEKPAAEAAKPEETRAVETAAATPAAAAPEVKAPETAPVAPAKPVEAVKPEVKVESKPAPAPASAATPPAAVAAAAPTAKPEIKVEPTKPIETAASGLKDNEIILEALDKVDITFAVNNGPAVRLSLQPAQVHTIKAKGQVAMDVSDGGAVNVILNGQDNGTLGDLGKPKKVKYP